MPRNSVRAAPTAFFALPALIVGGAVAAAVHQRWQISSLAGWLVVVNVATAVLYGYDKGAATWGTLRVPERLLNGLALLGGSPAALLYQRILHHKTRKATFRRSFWFIVVLQTVVLLAWWSRR